MAPDATRASALTPVEDSEAPKTGHEVEFLQNVFDELRRRVPAEQVTLEPKDLGAAITINPDWSPTEI